MLSQSLGIPNSNTMNNNQAEETSNRENIAVGTLETVESTIEAEEAGVETEIGIVDAAEILGEAAEISTAVDEASAGLQVAIGVSETLPTIFGWIAGSLTLVLIGALAYKIVEAIKKEDNLENNKVKRIDQVANRSLEMDEMVRKILEIEENAYYYINSKSHKNNEIIEYMDDIISQRDIIVERLEFLCREYGISLLKLIREAAERAKEFTLREDALDKIVHQQSQLIIKLEGIFDEKGFTI
ncbi:hypothetical protein [Wolbachia endosymbiont of Pentidionis agamae]|uniref:hypothetical protein n=1 Tax=Wolbachia endosymbiont of Pentidionis agamae TaxID=3110435 RepID=UPI002FD33DCA